MKQQIGFWPGKPEPSGEEAPTELSVKHIAPVRSVAEVYFPVRNMTLSYYNDAFDLQPGDIVFVEGKLEGWPGRVLSVAYNFKIKLTDYKRVIGRADTEVRGQFHLAGSHLLTFDAEALPFEQAITWFKAPDAEDDEYAWGSDNSSFPLDGLAEMKVSAPVFSSGQDYYRNNKVSYICLDGSRGRAIVEGRRPYELEFTYRDGAVSDLVCNCFCSGGCKHQVAAMLQLSETLELIENSYAPFFAASGYFAAISKSVFFSLVIDGKKQGTLTL